MLGRSASLSLTARLVDQYLMFGLAGLFACVVISVMLAWHGTLTQLVSITVLLPLGVLLAGAWFLRRTLRLNTAVEAQLAQFAGQAAAPEDAVLRPLPNVEHPAALGWNRLLERLHDVEALALIDQRLNASLDSVQQKKWESLFNSMPDGSAVTDESGRLTSVNQRFAMLCETSPEQLSARPLDQALAPLCNEESRVRLATLVAAKGASAAELCRGANVADGVMRLCRTPLLDESFAPGSALWSLRDITQQKLAEDARNQFVFTATHELRTPLANIKAYAETLTMTDDIDCEQQKGFFNIINAEATRLARFVDDLLNVSQMEAGGLTVDRHELDLARLLDEVVENVSPQSLQKRIKLQRDLPPKLPALRADKDKLAAALVNLIGNGIKYTPEGGEVRLVVEAQPNSIDFHVEDTGIGIAPEELPRLCEKFFRSKDERVQKITGSGLGLAFSQEVARLHGGKITVQSELNKGSRFSLSIPL